jgi:hypothetical protein
MPAARGFVVAEEGISGGLRSGGRLSLACCLSLFEPDSGCERPGSVKSQHWASTCHMDVATAGNRKVSQARARMRGECMNARAARRGAAGPRSSIGAIGGR